MPNILIIGASGFVGTNIINNPSIKDEVGNGFFKEFSLINSCPSKNKDFYYLDLLNLQSIEDIIKEKEPKYIIHLASISFIPSSFGNPKKIIDINYYGTFNLLETLKKYSFNGRLLYVSSGDVYGKFKEDNLPLKETQPLSPKNPYAASKGAAELLCIQYTNAYSLDIVIARPFNHIGPHQSDLFSISGFARQCALISLNKKEPIIKTGNVNTYRDFLDVRDVIKAYFLLLYKGISGEIYNVCSGKPLKISFILERLISFTGRDISIETDTQRLRFIDIIKIYGDNSKLKNDTGFKINYDIDLSLLDIYNYWVKEENK
ncbi:MAG: GDP-mannose 4,6-dehydratase [bacterium]